MKPYVQGENVLNWDIIDNGTLNDTFICFDFKNDFDFKGFWSKYKTWIKTKSLNNGEGGVLLYPFKTNTGVGICPRKLWTCA